MAKMAGLYTPVKRPSSILPRDINQIGRSLCLCVKQTDVVHTKDILYNIVWMKERERKGEYVVGN